MSAGIARAVLAPNPMKPGAIDLAGRMREHLERDGVDVCVLDIDGCAGRDACDSKEVVAGADVLVVLGGDGTILRWSKVAGPLGVPMMGVNFGQYGFITEVQPDQAMGAIERVLSGDYFVSERVMLKAEVERNNKPVAIHYALNEVVVSIGPLARMLELQTYIGDKFIVSYAADGIIVSSPTGSTAYSMSAGGPVTHPSVEVLIITPVCPHTLNERSLVIPDSETVRIVGECTETETSFMMTVDGQIGEHLSCSDVVRVGKADFKARMIQMEPQSFYNKLQSRLHWGERFFG